MHAIAGDTPGVSVNEGAMRELITVIEPDEGNPQSGLHGIGVRPID